jgi:hypothetical protein
MSVYDVTVTKIRQLPESLIQEVSDFADFLLENAPNPRIVRHEAARVAVVP